MLVSKKKDAALALPVETKVRKPDEDKEESEYDSLESAFEDLMHAVNSKNTKAGAAALRAAFELCGSYPHEEGPHIQGDE